MLILIGTKIVAAKRVAFNGKDEPGRTCGGLEP